MPSIRRVLSVIGASFACHTEETYPPFGSPPLKFTGRQEGGFLIGWFWRTCPRSRFRSGGTCERTLVPVFVPGNIRTCPRSGFRSGGTSAKTTLLETTLFGSSEKRLMCWRLSRLARRSCAKKGGCNKWGFKGHKNPRTHKNRIGTSTSPPSRKPQHPPLKRGILWAWGFSGRKSQKCQALLKLAQPLRPQKRGRKNYGHEDFSPGLPWAWTSAVSGLFRPFSAFFGLCLESRRAPGKSRKHRKKLFVLRYPGICFNAISYKQRRKNNLNVNFSGRIPGGRTPGKEPFFFPSPRIYAGPSPIVKFTRSS